MYPFQIQDIIDLAVQAGQAAMEIYRQDFAVYEKEDQSPVTDADLAAEKIIFDALTRLTPDIPIIGEEHTAAGAIADLSKQYFWLVDPIDGTADFVHKNGEFTVNIGLIDGDKPVFGVVYAPALDEMYYTESVTEAFLLKNGVKTPLKARSVPAQGMTVLTSRFHCDEMAAREMVGGRPVAEYKAYGSSLKFCAIAAGKADFYPCTHLTKEWDTAAAQAVLVAAGGAVLATETNEPLRYRKEGLKNPRLIAVGAV
ncbi:MAG: 3'(2'),5'-bisphosphate nucleotidase CysQ [Alphaproteobacteria bacterium]|nr:3'(2'),5'-bisphosphate nucleotidase CysQ [Alphaproteobacteria bacterium]